MVLLLIMGEKQKNDGGGRMRQSVIICYCKNVTEAEIIEHVAVRQCCATIEDIQAHTGANTGNQCHIKNPAGI